MDYPPFLKVKVYPNSKNEEVNQKTNDEFVIKVREKAERGEANQRVKKLLSAHLGLPEEKLILVRGATKPHKIFKVMISS